MIDYNLCYTIPMIIKHTRDTLSETYLDAVAIRNTVFVKGQGVPRSIDIDANEAYCIHFVLYDDKGQATATVRLLPNIDLTQVTLQRMAVLDDYQGQGLGSILLKEAEDFAQEQQGIGMCNITKCCTEVCPEHIKITDNAIIPMKERVVDRKYDPVVWLGNKIGRRKD